MFLRFFATLGKLSVNDRPIEHVITVDGLIEVEINSIFIHMKIYHFFL